MKRQIEADRFIFGGGSCVGGAGGETGKVAKFILKFQGNRGVGTDGGAYLRRYLGVEADRYRGAVTSGFVYCSVILLLLSLA